MRQHTYQIGCFWTGTILLLVLACWRVSHTFAPSPINAAERQGTEEMTDVNGMPLHCPDTTAECQGTKETVDVLRNPNFDASGTSCGTGTPGVFQGARTADSTTAPGIFQDDRTTSGLDVSAENRALSPQSSLQTYPAIVKPHRTCTLAFLVGGTVAEVCADIGDTLHAGDTLLKLDTQDFERDVQLATANLQAARERLAMLEHGARDEDLAIIEAKLASALAQRDYLASEYERAKPLQEKNAITLSDLALMFSKVRIAEAEVHSLQKELQKARSGGRPEEIRILKAEITALEVKLTEAEALLADTTLTVPFDGVLAECLVQPHEVVRPGHAVATLVDVSQFSVAIQIPESEIPPSGDFSQHFRGYVVLSSFPKRQYPVSFQKIEPTADDQTHCWRVTLTLEAPTDHVVLPGMACRVQLGRFIPHRVDHDSP